MVIAGAGGHAAELLEVLMESDYRGDIYFFDDMTSVTDIPRFGTYRVLTSLDAVREVFSEDPDFAIGVGRPSARKTLYDKLTGAGGIARSIVSPYAHIGRNGIELGEGLNIMTAAVITSSAKVGRGTLVHVHCSIHHDTVIGEFCELSPGCRILGKAVLDSYVSIGAGAVILPGIHVAEHAVVGAGAVVTKHVMAGKTVTGIPAR